MPLKYEDYASDVKPREKLDKKIDAMNEDVDVHLVKIADELLDLDKVEVELKLHHKFLTDIREEHPRDVVRQRIEFLRAWKRVHGPKATYDWLLRACVETNNDAAATKIVELLKNVNEKVGKGHVLKRIVSGALNKMKEQIKTGNPRLHVPVLDPLRLDDFDFSVNEPAINCEANFYDVVITGLESITFPKIDFDEENLKLTVTANVVELKATGKYKVDGTALFFLPLKGNDDVFADAETVSATINVQLSSLDIAKSDYNVSGISFEVESIKVNFRNLEGEDDLGDTLNEILSLFGKQIFDLAEPAISKEVESALQKLLDEDVKSIFKR